MKKILLVLSITLFAILVTYAQENSSELLNQRNQHLQHYKAFKDTMTIRTWINMVELSSRLEAVVLIDNILLDSLLIDTPNNANLEAKLRELTGVRDQLITDNARLNVENVTSKKRESNLIFIVVVVSIILIIVAISWIRYMMRCKQMEKTSGKNSKKVTNLKQMQKEEVDALKDEIKKLKEDQLLMENNASQIKKSYELLKSESDIKPEDISVADEDALEDIRKEMKALSTEIANILGEKDKLEKALKKANEELASQKDDNKSMEDELENILKKFKNKPD